MKTSDKQLISSLYEDVRDSISNNLKSRIQLIVYGSVSYVVWIDVQDLLADAMYDEIFRQICDEVKRNFK